MKTIIVFSLLATSIILTSCNKESDWVCTCTVNGQKTQGVLFDYKKKDAKERCKNISDTSSLVKDCRITGEEDDL